MNPEIERTIQEYKEVCQKAKELNSKLLSHFEPLLNAAGLAGDRKAFNELLEAIPEGPALMRAYRYEAMYFG